MKEMSLDKSHGPDRVDEGDARTYDPLTAPYDIDENDFPSSGEAREQFAFLLRYAILAPSTHNTQPWKFAVNDDGVEVYADYTKRMPVVDPHSRELLMSIGAAVYNLRVAATYFGLEHRVDYGSSGASEQPLAYVRLAPAAGRPRHETPLGSLFPGIRKRHTATEPFLQTRLPDSALQHVRDVGRESSVTVTVSTDGDINQKVAHLVMHADRTHYADPEFRRELAEWMHPGSKTAPDGLTRVKSKGKAVASALMPWATRVLDAGKIRGTDDKNLTLEAPGLVVLSAQDSTQHWIETGEVLEEMLLTFVREGFHYGYLNMPIQVPTLRLELRGLLGLSSWPQLLLRMGYGLSEPAPTPRRRLEDVLVAGTSERPVI